MDPQQFLASWEGHHRLQAAALVLLTASAIAGSYLTVTWIRANRRHLDAVWPTMAFSGLAAAPGLALFAKLAYRVASGRIGIRLEGWPSYESPFTLACGLWILVGPALLFISSGPALPDAPIPKGLTLVQVSHGALWLASSVLAITLIGDA